MTSMQCGNCQTVIEPPITDECRHCSSRLLFAAERVDEEVTTA